MRLLFSLLALAVTASAQSTYIGNPTAPLFNTIRSGLGAPSVFIGNNGDFYVDATVGSVKFYGPKYLGSWGTGTSIASGGTTSCSAATATTLGCVIAASGSGISVDGAGHISVSLANLGILPATQLPALTGDVTSSAGSAATTLATVNSTPGSYGDSTHSVTLTVDAKGRLTAVGQVSIAGGGGGGSGLPDPGANGIVVRTAANTTSAIAAPSGTVVGTSDTQTLTNKSIDAGQLTGTVSGSRLPAFTGDATTSAGSTATTLATVNSSPGSYGDSTHSVTLTVDGKGRITAVSQSSISGGGGGSGVPAGPLASLPTTCTTGSLYFATDQPAGQELYGCSATNTWTQFNTLGPSGALAYSGGSLDIVTSIVPLLSSANNFSGLDIFGNGIELTTLATGQPTCGSSTDGLLWFLGNGATAAETWQNCAFNGTSYAWSGFGGTSYTFPGLTGDVTSSSGSYATTLATVNSSPGSYGDGSHTTTLTTDGKGRVTANSSTAISITHSAVSDFASAVAAAAPITGAQLNGTTITPSAGVVNVQAITGLILNGTTLTPSAGVLTLANLAITNGANSFSGVQTFATNILCATDGGCSLGASGANRFYQIYASSSINAGGYFYSGSGLGLVSGTRSKITAPSDGQWLLQNNGGTNFTDLIFGAATSGFSEFRITSTLIEAKLGDNSGYAKFGAKSFAGGGTATFAAGSGAGTSPTVACASSRVCDSFTGEVTVTTGTSPATGTLLTITTGVTRSNAATCTYNVDGGTTFLAPSKTETTTTLAISLGVAPAASTAYTVTYVCGGN